MMPQELAKIMGWKTLQMAMRYCNPTAQELAARMRAVEAARSGPSHGAADALEDPQANGPDYGSAVTVPVRRVGYPAANNVVHVEFVRASSRRTRAVA